MNLKAIDFEATVNNGLIILPEQYNLFSVKTARIVILYDPVIENKYVNTKQEKLKQVIQKLQQINPFKEIKDPVQWQKQQRDEWERCIIR